MPFIKERMKLMRKNQKMTLQELADLMKLARTTVNKYESGELPKIDIDTIERLAHFLNCDLAYLIGLQGTPHVVAGELDKDEQLLVDTYRNLNEQGQYKLLDLADDLVSSKKYQKSDKSQLDKKHA